MIKVAFVGTGGIATYGHLPALAAMEEVEITALCDVSEERVQAAVEKFGGKAYTDYRRMLDAEDLDVLYVCVPPFAHEDAEILAAQKGLHLFVEKPVALTMEKGLEIAEAIEKAGVLSCVGYSLRYLWPTDAAKAFLADRPIALVAADRWGGVPGDETHWWRVMDKSGGQLVEMATHQVDLIRYLAGEIVEVYARYARRVLGDLPNLTVPDAQVVALQFASGAVGYISTSCALTKGGGRGQLDFVLRDLILHYGHDRLSTTPAEVASFEPPDQRPPSINEAFIGAVRSGDASLIKTPYADGLRSLDVTLAANRSAVEGKPVRPLLT